MLKKRLIGVVTVKNGWAVQSFGYSKYLPLGKLECLIENLDRWGADEILVQVIDCSINKKGPDFALLDKLANLGLKTPLIYCGGIRSVSDAVRLIQSGADRIVVDSLLRDSADTVEKISLNLGAQAVIASLPLSDGDGLIWYDYRNRKSSYLTSALYDLIESDLVSELMVIDWKNEGFSSSFDEKVLNQLPFKNLPLILFGGLNNINQMRSLLDLQNISAIALGNFFSYKEHSVQIYKKQLNSVQMRPAIYDSLFSLETKNYD